MRFKNLQSAGDVVAGAKNAKVQASSIWVVEAEKIDGLDVRYGESDQ